MQLDRLLLRSLLGRNVPHVLADEEHVRSTMVAEIELRLHLEQILGGACARGPGVPR
jgi:hypothetical protein